MLFNPRINLQPRGRPGTARPPLVMSLPVLSSVEGSKAEGSNHGVGVGVTPTLIFIPLSLPSMP